MVLNIAQVERTDDGATLSEGEQTERYEPLSFTAINEPQPVRSRQMSPPAWIPPKKAATSDATRPDRPRHDSSDEMIPTTQVI